MLRIIHVVENLDKGAVENWLVNIFLESRKSRPEWEWTFYCILGKNGRLDNKVLEAGGKIIYSPYWISEKYRFLKAFRRTLRRGKYQIIHSHHDYLSGFYLLATSGLSFKKRILHIHNTDKALPVGSALVHKVLLPVFHRFATHFSDLIIGISNDTLKEFVGSSKFRKKTAVLYYGIDLAPFAVDSGKEWLRQEFNIPANGKILLFIGRMSELKNPVFVIDILKELSETRQDVYAVFIGKGDLGEAVAQRAKKYGLAEKIRMPGWRNDAPSIMHASDVFVFPRVEYPREGLGLVVVEAQAAGIPMVLSRGIVEDAIVIEELSHVVPLCNNAAEWASVINMHLNKPPAISRSNAYQRMQRSKFSLPAGTRNLIELYEG